MLKSRAFKIIVSIVVSLAFLGLALNNIDFGKLGKTFLRLNPLWLAVVTGLILFSYFLRSWMWKILLQSHFKTRLWNLFRIITIGYFANNLLPLRLGEVIRAWLLGKRERIPTSLALATVVIERGMDLFALLFFFTFMMSVMPFAPWLKLSGAILAGIGLVFALVLILNYFFGGHLIEIMERPLHALPGGIGQWVHTQLGKFLAGLKLIVDLGQFLRVLGLSLCTWLCWIGVTYACFLAMGLKLPFYAAIFLVVVLNFGLMIPSSPGGLGVFEYMVILALTPYGVEKETALGVGFVYHMLQYILTFVLGWLFSIQLNISMSAMVQQPETLPDNGSE